MAFVPAVLGALASAAAIAGTVTSISAQKSAAKKTKSQTEQAARVRAEELAKASTSSPESLVAQAEVLPEKAKAEAGAVMAGIKKRRATIATSSRGLLGEPTVLKPTLLGA